MPFPARPAQTRIKHEILHGYIGAWMGIICNGIGRNTRIWRQPQFLYLDGFAGPGVYDGDVHDPHADNVFGSPIIGMKALEKGAEIARERYPALRPEIGGVLIEQDVEFHRELLASLRRAGVKMRVEDAASAAPVTTGQARTVCGDYRAEFPQLLRSVPSDAFLFAFIDPFGQAARMDCVAPLIDRPKTDAIIFFPSWSVLVRGGSVRTSESERTPQHHSNITRNNELFGTRAWQEIALDDEVSSEAKVQRYVDLYRARLAKVSRPFLIKTIGLQFSGASSEEAGYHLFLITDNANGALKMNEVLREAEARKHWELWLDMEARTREREERAEIIPLGLELEDQRSTRDIQGPSDEDVDDLIYQAVVGRKLTWGELKEELAQTILTEAEIRKSLTRLNRHQSIDRPSRLRQDSVITWLM